MQTKLSQLLALMASGDWSSAIRLAARFPRLGHERDDILRAKDALLQPDFYRQLGRDGEWHSVEPVLVDPDKMYKK